MLLVVRRRDGLRRVQERRLGDAGGRLVRCAQGPGPAARAGALGSGAVAGARGGRVFPAQLVVRGEKVVGEGQGRRRGAGEGRRCRAGRVPELPAAEPAEEPGGGAGGGRVAAVAQRRRRGGHPGVDPAQGRLLREAGEGTVELSPEFSWVISFRLRFRDWFSSIARG